MRVRIRNNALNLGKIKYQIVGKGKSDQPEKVGGPGPTRHLVHGAEDQVVLRVPHQTKQRSHVITVLCIWDETPILYTSA
jgi:hypothetical protein